MAGGQDDAARLNGLMAAMGKKEAENASLRAKLAEFEAQGDSQAQEPATADSQPEYQDGVDYRWDAESQQMVEQDPGTPERHNGITPRDRRPSDDGSAEWAKQQLRRSLGDDEPKTTWP